jgi:hypothetical protein
MRAPAIIVLSLLIAGCGGDGRRDALKIAEDWLHAVERRDTDTACALMHPSATDAIRKKYAPSGEKGNCPNVIRIYHDSFADGVLESILDTGLEAEGTVKNEEIGVFPKTGQREFEVILMRRRAGKWKVASTSISAVPTQRETPEPSPAGDQS